MKSSQNILFAFPGNEKLASSITQYSDLELTDFTFRHFPDKESYLRIEANVEQKNVYILCSLDRPDEKLLPIYFLAKHLKEIGAKGVHLIAPYLSYMRQDRQFQEGEIITSKHFAALLSSFVDSLITVDPHLHRYTSLNEIYSIPTKVLHTSDLIAEWIKVNVQNPVLIGPDSESKQWVAKAAESMGIPYIILQKTRLGDKSVRIEVPNTNKYIACTPVLLDDIISTARTMITTIMHLKQSGLNAPVCIGVHAIFADNAFEEMLDAGAEKIITCNTIEHSSNAIDIADLIKMSIN